MSYNSKNYYSLKEEFEKKHLAAAEKADLRRVIAEEKIEGLRDVNAALRLTASRIFGAALEGKEGLQERINLIKRETAELSEAKRTLLQSAGYPADYLDIKYDCSICKDTGFNDTKMCSCFKKALVLKGYEASGLGVLIGKQSFDNYSLSYFSGEELKQMKNTLSIIKDYAESFSKDSGSLLFMGCTGVGKTHLSSAVAKTVIDRGYDVFYTTALDMIGDLERFKFRGEGDTARYFDSELLIIDDLGSEGKVGFAETFVYNVLDTRIRKGLSTVISTNLTGRDLTERYGERICSRLFGLYTVLPFVGKDIRVAKD